MNPHERPWMIEPWHTEPLSLDNLLRIAFRSKTMQIDACKTAAKIITETNRNVFRIHERRIERMINEIRKEKFEKWEKEHGL